MKNKIKNMMNNKDKTHVTDDEKESRLPIRVLIIIIAILVVIGIALLIYFNNTRIRTDADIRDAPYSERVGSELNKMAGEPGSGSSRPDYLPPEMFEELPEFPKDFYQVRSLIRSGRLVDYANLEEEYWQQPEFFPNFEDIGAPLLANPPEGRWGAFGIATFPADQVATLKQGETLEMYFFIKSNYLVETYQGINLIPVFENKVQIKSGFEMPDGTTTITQYPEKMESYFTVSVEPNPFVLYPNFPKYHPQGTKKVKVIISASADTPPGNYVLGLDTGEVPEEYEQKWLREFLNLYTSGGMTKIDRPYFQAFVEVIGGEN